MEYSKSIEEKIKKVVSEHKHEHPLYQETEITASLINEDKRIAAFVLFEQIDTDRTTQDGNGWLGDQYRYSVWYIENDQEPKRIFEDHDYLRKTVSTYTKSRGRDVSINLLGLEEDGILVEITPKNANGGTFTKTKVKIKKDGKIEEPKEFLEQAANLIKRIGPSLGYDSLREMKRLENKDLTAIVYSTENGSTYGYDTLYVVWVDKNKELKHQEIANTRGTRGYIFIDNLLEDEEQIKIKARGKEYSLDKNFLGFK